MSETKLTAGRVRTEMAAIERTLERLSNKLDRMFPGARDQPGEGCILRETVVGIGQASSYIGGFRLASKEHINFLIEDYGLAALSEKGRE